MNILEQFYIPLRCYISVTDFNYLLQASYACIILQNQSKKMQVAVAYL